MQIELLLSNHCCFFFSQHQKSVFQSTTFRPGCPTLENSWRSQSWRWGSSAPKGWIPAHQERVPSNRCFNARVLTYNHLKSYSSFLNVPSNDTKSRLPNDKAEDFAYSDLPDTRPLIQRYQTVGCKGRQPTWPRQDPRRFPENFPFNL